MSLVRIQAGAAIYLCNEASNSTPTFEKLFVVEVRDKRNPRAGCQNLILGIAGFEIEKC